MIPPGPIAKTEDYCLYFFLDRGIVIFNSLSKSYETVLHVMVTNPNGWTVYDEADNPVLCQINPVLTTAKTVSSTEFEV